MCHWCDASNDRNEVLVNIHQCNVAGQAAAHVVAHRERQQSILFTLGSYLMGCAVLAYLSSALEVLFGASTWVVAKVAFSWFSPALPTFFDPKSSLFR